MRSLISIGFIIFTLLFLSCTHHFEPFIEADEFSYRNLKVKRYPFDWVFFGEYRVSGEIINNSQNNYLLGYFRFDFYDKQGNVFEIKTAAISNLPAGKSKTFEETLYIGYKSIGKLDIKFVGGILVGSPQPGG